MLFFFISDFIVQFCIQPYEATWCIPVSRCVPRYLLPPVCLQTYFCSRSIGLNTYEGVKTFWWFRVNVMPLLDYYINLWYYPFSLCCHNIITMEFITKDSSVNPDLIRAILTPITDYSISHTTHSQCFFHQQRIVKPTSASEPGQVIIS